MLRRHAEAANERRPIVKHICSKRSSRRTYPNKESWMVGWARIFRRQIAEHSRLMGALATIVVEQFHGLAQESSRRLCQAKGSGLWLSR